MPIKAVKPGYTDIPLMYSTVELITFVINWHKLAVRWLLSVLALVQLRTYSGFALVCTTAALWLHYIMTSEAHVTTTT